jgi:T6SS, Phospholipase effector Tle1-like, catalytic domain
VPLSSRAAKSRHQLQLGSLFAHPERRGARDPDCPEGTPRESAETSKSALGGVVDHRGAGRDSDSTGPEGWDRMDRFAEALSIRRVENRLSFPIEFLGLFDTVKGTGIIGRDLRWPYTNQLSNVRLVRHAVSIDERRRPFRESLVPVQKAGRQPLVTLTTGLSMSLRCRTRRGSW